jgi:hypothetical protein
MGRRQKPDGETSQGPQAAVSPPEFFRNSGIGVDGGNAQVLAGNLSPLGRLFEIYFVRLIGTPNQNSRDAGSGRHQVSSSNESLGLNSLSESLILAQNERWRRG